jgi:flagellar protein FliO/FliZ
VFIATFIACILVPTLYAQDEEAAGVPAVEPAAESPAAEAPAVDPLVTERIRAYEETLMLEEGETGTTPSPVSSVWSILRVLLTLVLVAAAIYGLVFFIKKASKGKTVRDPFLKVLASAPLGVNKNAFVVSVGSQAWLVGTAENGVNLIGEIGDKDILNAMLLEDSKRSEAGETPAGRFSDFKSFLRKLGMQFESGEPGPGNIRKRRERLKGL